MRLRFFISAISLLLSGVCFAQSDMPAADSASLDFKQWGLLAIQDGGRRKPIDTFARETLIKTTGRSSYTDARGKKWQANDFVLSMLLDTHDWKSEPMILVSLGQLIEKLGLDKTKRRFSFTAIDLAAGIEPARGGSARAREGGEAARPSAKRSDERERTADDLRACHGRKRRFSSCRRRRRRRILGRAAGLRPLL